MAASSLSSSSSQGGLGIGSSLLLDLVGKRWEDTAVRAFLVSTSKNQKLLEEVHKYAALGKRKACEYHNFKQLGLSICVEGGVIEAVHIYNGSQKFAVFGGELPYNLRINMMNAEVVRLLGEPDLKEGGSRKGPITIGYSSRGLQIVFVGDSWEDTTNPIDCITFYGESSSCDQ